MKIKGYEVGEIVSDEELALYRSIRHRLTAEWVAKVVGYFDFDGGDLTQKEFEHLVWRYEDVEHDYFLDESVDDNCLRWALDDILAGRSYR